MPEPRCDSRLEVLHGCWYDCELEAGHDFRHMRIVSGAWVEWPYPGDERRWTPPQTTPEGTNDVPTR